MRYVAVARATVVGLALLLFLSVCSVSSGAEEVIAANVITLRGTANVTKPDGTTETLQDTTKPIVLPATIEMVGEKGSFSISLPSAITGKFNTISWSMRQGETVRVSVLKTKRGVAFEYLKGTRKFYLDVNNRENVLLVRSITRSTSVVVLQNKVTVPEKASALLKHPMNCLASVTVVPMQVTEVEFSYSPADRYIETVVIEPPAVPPVEALAVPVSVPETIEQSTYQP